MLAGMKKLTMIKRAARSIMGTIVSNPLSPFAMGISLFPKVIETTCLRKPTNTRASTDKVIITVVGCVLMPADNIENSVIKIPNGGTPVIARNPMKNKTLVTGRTFRTPFTFLIFVELYFTNIFPADKNRTDFASA